MKILIRLFIALVVIAGGLYGGVWYVTCTELEKKISTDGFTLHFDPDGKSLVEFKPVVASVHFTGYEKGQAKIAYAVSSATAKSVFAIGPTVGESLAVVKSETPVIYYIGGDIYGDTVRLQVDEYKDVIIEQTVNKVAIPKTSLVGKSGGFELKFKNKDLFYNRLHALSQYSGNYKKIFEDIRQVRFLPTDVSMNNPDTGAMIAHSVLGDSVISWNVSQDGTFSLDSVVDIDATYGKMFSEYLSGATKAQVSMIPSASGASELVSKLQGAFFDNNKMKIKGGIHLKFAADKIGMSTQSQNIAGLPVSPFEILIDHLEYQLPLPFSREHVLNAKVAFARGEGKPLAVSYDEDSKSGNSQVTVDAIIKMIAEVPEVKETGVDLAKVTPGSFTSFSELQSSQGAIALIVSSFKAWQELLLNATTKTQFLAQVATESGKPSPLEMLGAEGKASFSTTLGHDIAIAVNGEAHGLASWSGAVSLKNFDKLITAIKDPFRIFVARSFLTTFFNVETSVTPSGESTAQEKKLLDFIFSDSLFDEAIATFNKICRLVDETPDTTDEVTVKLSGQAGSFLISGKAPEAYLAEMAPKVLAESSTLVAKVEEQVGALQQSMPSTSSPNLNDMPPVAAQRTPPSTAEVTLDFKKANGKNVAVVSFPNNGVAREIYYQLGTAGARQSTGEGMVKDPVTGAFPAQQVIQLPESLNENEPLLVVLDWVDNQGQKHGPKEIYLNLR